MVLLYEPSTAKGRPVPIARINDASMILLAARAAVAHAQARAVHLSQVDELLGEVEQIEADRLVKTLALLIPGLIEAHVPVVLSHLQ
jgi:hypothetical protein